MMSVQSSSFGAENFRPHLLQTHHRPGYAVFNPGQKRKLVLSVAAISSLESSSSKKLTSQFLISQSYFLSFCVKINAEAQRGRGAEEN